MRSPTRKLLEILFDGEWHVYDELIHGVGVNTVRFCINQGFVVMKMVDQKRQCGFETYRCALRITRRGKTVLRNNSSSPTA